LPTIDGMAMTALPRDHADPRPWLPGPRRGQPQLLVALDGSAPATRRLVWALREAARREAVVLAVGVIEARAGEDAREAARTLLEAQTRHAVAEAGVPGRVRTALLDPVVLEALGGAVAGADLFVVETARSTVLRPAVPRPRSRRPLTRCT
jgi:hypothetical protein